MTPAAAVCNTQRFRTISGRHRVLEPYCVQTVDPIYLTSNQPFRPLRLHVFTFGYGLCATHLNVDHPHTNLPHRCQFHAPRHCLYSRTTPFTFYPRPLTYHSLPPMDTHVYTRSVTLDFGSMNVWFPLLWTQTFCTFWDWLHALRLVPHIRRL